MIVAAATLGGIMVSPAVARADCGMHAFQTIVLPQLKAADATPTTGIAVIHTPDHSTDNQTLLTLLTPAFDDCGDEPAMQNAVAHFLTVEWLGAEHARAIAAAYAYVASGATNAPPACIPYEKYEARFQIAQEFAVRGPGGFNVHSASDPRVAALLAAARKTPYYQHIVQLWTDAMGHLGMKWPGFANGNYGYNEPFRRELAIQTEHLPNGVSCNEQPGYYTIKAAPPTATP